MDTTRLFDPIQVRGVMIRNRVWISPMCQYSADGRDGIATQWHTVHYGVMARGGAGLIMVEATGIVPEGRISPFCLGIWDDAHVEPLRSIVDFAHSQGAKIGIQLAHAGRKGSAFPWTADGPEGSIPIGEGGWQTTAPSEEPFGSMRVPKAFTVDELDELVNSYVAAADRAVLAGFDVLEVHTAHGYLLHEFLSPLSNHRNDEYGGSLENRARIHRRIVSAIRASHPDVPIFVRISASEWVDGGFDVDEAATVVGWLGEDGADFFDVSSGGNTVDAPIDVRASYQVPFAAAIRNDTGLPVAAVGLITEAAQAESIITTGQADAVFIGREALRNPHVALHWAPQVHAKNTAVPEPLWRGFV